MLPRCNLAASQRRPYCDSMNSHSPVGLVSQQWDAVDWACVLCDCHIHSDQVSRSVSQQCAFPFYSSHASFFGKASHHPGLSAPIQPRFGSLQLLAFPKAKITVEREEICECDGHTVHKVSQWRLTADWLATRYNDCSWTHSKVSSDWLPSYIKATCLVLKIFKMAGYFPDNVLPHCCSSWSTRPCWRRGNHVSLKQEIPKYTRIPKYLNLHFCYLYIGGINSRTSWDYFVDPLRSRNFIWKRLSGQLFLLWNFLDFLNEVTSLL